MIGSAVQRSAVRSLAAAACASRLPGLLGRPYRGSGVVFSLHSVVTDRRAVLDDRLYTGLGYLKRLLGDLSRRGVDIVTLDDAAARLRTGDDRPFACFTFDDGYRDNLDIVLPVFERIGRPFTVYVTCAFLDRTYRYWWAALRSVVLANESVEIDALGRRFATRSLAEKRAAYRRLCRMASRGHLPDPALDALLARYRARIEDVLDRVAMDEADLKRLAQSPLVTIGGHTRSHPHLSRLGAAAVRDELAANKHRLETLTGREARHVAYPYGGPASCGPREFELARSAGFRTGVTTRIGLLTRRSPGQAMALPRIRPFNRYESLSLIELQRTGAVNALLAGLGRRSIDP